MSIDTNNAGETARAAVYSQGAHIVNDISAGDDDAAMLATVGAAEGALHCNAQTRKTAKPCRRIRSIRRCGLPTVVAVLLSKN